MPRPKHTGWQGFRFRVLLVVLSAESKYLANYFKGFIKTVYNFMYVDF